MIVTGETITEYHANDSVSHTGLKDFKALGPKGYFHRHVQKHPDAQREATAALTAGQQFESYLDGEWEPVVAPSELPDEKGEVKPWHGNRKVCKQWLADNPNAVSPAEAAMYQRMRDAVMENATARALLETAQRQVTFRADYPGLPAGFQARPDYVVRDAFLGDVIVDLKTCESLDVFRRNVQRYGYNTQAGMACQHARLAGMDPSFYLLVVEKMFPTRCVLYRLSEATIRTGWAWCQQQLDTLAEHYEADHWPPTESDVEDLDAPVWGMEIESEEAA